jgi:DNA-binding winged helix-turn-helix (wHTH) protein/Tol biopolymer transport system component
MYTVFRFGPFELSERDGELRKNGVRIKLQEQPFRVLVELLANAGTVVTREELKQKLWPADTFVDFDVGLNTAIRKIRQALGDDADHPHYIETAAKRGYRFLALISKTAGDSAFLNESAPAPPASVPVTPLQLETQTGERSIAQSKYLRWYLLLLALAAVAVAGVIVTRVKGRPPQPAIERRVTTNSPEAPIRWAVISPDGKYLAYTGPSEMYIRQLDTGEVRRLALSKEFNVPVPVSWFPDSTDLVFVEWSDGDEHARSIWRLSILGGDPQKLMDDAWDPVVSPDGSHITFVRGRDVWIMESNGASARRIVNGADGLDPAYVGTILVPVVWSPTGRRIAYIQHYWSGAVTREGVSSSIWTRDSSGGNPALVMTGTKIGDAVYWASDGRLLYSVHEETSSNTATDSLWAIKVDPYTGKPNGSPQCLLRGFGSISSLTVSTDGKRATLLRNNMANQVFVAEFDKNTRHLNASHRLTLDENSNLPFAWTPDSKSVLFSSNRNGSWKIFKQQIGEATAELVVEGQGVYMPRLSADGSEVLYMPQGYPPENASIPVGIMRKNLAGGAPQEVLRQSAIYNIQCARIPSRLCLFSTQVAGTTTFFSFEPEHGKGSEVARMTETGEGVDWSLSPDGSLLAIINFGEHEGRIRFMSLPSRSVREVVLKDWPRLSNVDWSPDGAGLFLPSTTSNSTPVLLFANLEGKARVLWEGQKYAPLIWAVPSPDGHYLALNIFVGETNVWMIENF